MTTSNPAPHSTVPTHAASMPQTAIPQSPSQTEALLAQMHDVVSPTPIGLWPLAPGWWALSIASVFLLAVLSTMLLQRIRANRYRKIAKIEFKRIVNQAGELSDCEYAQGIHTLLKQTFIAAYPKARTRLTSLYGKAWLQLLAFTAPQNPKLAKQAWADVLYSPSTKIDKIELSRFAQGWIKHHKITDKVIQKYFDKLGEENNTAFPAQVNNNSHDDLQKASEVSHASI